MMIEPVSRRLSERCLSDLALDRLLAGESGAEARAQAGAHLAECAACEARHATLLADRERFDAEVFVAGLSARAARDAKIASAPRPIAPRRARLRSALSAMSAAAAVVLVAIAMPRPSGDDVRTKGGESLELFVRHADGRVDRVAPGETLRPGDAIRFSLSTPRGGYVAIAGMDSRPSVSAYAPVSSDTAIPMGAVRGHVLDGSIVLDDATGPERIVAFLCREPVPVSTLLAEARAALAAAGGDPRAVGTIDARCRQTSFLIGKTR